MGKNSKKYIFNEIVNAPNRNNRTIWYDELLKRLKCDNINAEYLSQKYWDIIRNNIELYEDLKMVLSELKNKYNLYILTDELLDIQKTKIKTLNIESDFKEIISSTNIGKLKPDKEVFEYALKVTNSDKSETVMIGDNPFRDIEGAKKAGLKTIWFKRGKYYYYPIKKENMPDFVITNYCDLIDTLKLL